MEVVGSWLDSRGCSEASRWHRISEGNFWFFAKKALLCDPKVLVERRNHAFYSTCAALVVHGACDWAYAQSMFQALRIWRFLCLRMRTNETWVDHMTRTGPVVARQVKKHGQPRVQTLDATCSAVCLEAGTPPDDARERRYWEESVHWRCDDEWRKSYIKLTRDDPRNSTKWKRRLPGRATYWERRFTRLLVMPGNRKSRPAVRGQRGAL